ncbi:MAG: metallophosphoesterase family protein [Leptolyngbyaceae bacterium]|nr:metallophosphoesterase family protein [Leptolyngbyaceae bacterium]
MIGILIVALLIPKGGQFAYRAFQSHAGRPPDQIHLSWVGDPTTTMTAMWHTYRQDTPSLIQYRPVGEEEWLMEVGMPTLTHPEGLIHTVTLHHLSPDSAYEYRIKADYYGNNWSDIFQFQTAPTEVEQFDVVFVADTGLIGRKDGLDTGTKAVVEAIAALNPSLILAGGDYAYYNTDDRYETLPRSIDAWFNQMMPITAVTPIMPTYGNHETLLKENYGLWLERFATPEGFENRRNYSFDIGSIHFISIFAIYEEQGLNPEVIDWLEQDIETAQSSGQQWIIPYMHVSPFAEGESHPSNLALRAQLGPLFERFGIEVVLSAHDQAYERTYPLVDVPRNNRPTSQSLSCYDAVNDGITWVKSSPGGKKSNKSNAFSIFRNPPSPWVAVRDNTMHVFTQLRFQGADRLEVETFGITDNQSSPVSLDQFSYDRQGRCTPQR